jgi:hypothetical protein
MYHKWNDAVAFETWHITYVELQITYIMYNYKLQVKFCVITRDWMEI